MNKTTVQHKDSASKNVARKSFKIRLRNIFIILLSIIVLFLLVVNMVFKLPVRDFYSMSSREFEFPDLGSGFIPQGVFCDSESDNIYLTGYMNDESANPLYIIDKGSLEVIKKVRLLNEDGSNHNLHTCGIAVYNKKIYITSCDTNLYVFDPEDVQKAEDGGSVICEAIVDLSIAGDNITASTVTVHDDNLVVSEFYRKGNYDTNESHWVSDDKVSQYAYAVEMKIENNNANIVKAYSIPSEAQGLCFDENNVYISESYGVRFSDIESYNLDKVRYDGKRNILGKDVDFYIMDSDSLDYSFSISPMSEEIDIVGNKMFIACESASSKYIFGKLLGANKCYSIDMTKLKEKYGE